MKTRVRVVLDIDVDTSNWELAYGVGAQDDLARDVTTYVAETIRNSAAGEEGAIVNVRVTAAQQPAGVDAQGE